jgi:aconitase A
VQEINQKMIELAGLGIIDQRSTISSQSVGQFVLCEREIGQGSSATWVIEVHDVLGANAALTTNLLRRFQ